jgi:acetylornithine deacetylase/succinyl-diaminopimelate desuccinylase-like protein
LFGERGYSAYERTALRPALDINGLTAGHTGPGGKGIVPARALAKLSFRLVPAQDPRRVALLLRRHLARYAPRGVGLHVTFSKAAAPVTIDPRRPALRAAHAALSAGFGRAPALLRSGGTIPVVGLMAARVGDPVLMGFALADDGMHGPNERVHLGALTAGGRSLVHFLSLIARPGAASGRPASDHAMLEVVGVDR